MAIETRVIERMELAPEGVILRIGGRSRRVRPPDTLHWMPYLWIPVHLRTGLTLGGLFSLLDVPDLFLLEMALQEPVRPYVEAARREGRRTHPEIQHLEVQFQLAHLETGHTLHRMFAGVGRTIPFLPLGSIPVEEIREKPLVLNPRFAVVAPPGSERPFLYETRLDPVELIWVLKAIFEGLSEGRRL